MIVWGLPLLPGQLSPVGLTAWLESEVFGVWLKASTCAENFHPVALPLLTTTRRYTYIYFGESQLFPLSIGILPLTSSHRTDLQL